MSKPGQCIRCGQPVGEHEAFGARCKANMKEPNEPEKLVRISRWWCIPLAAGVVLLVIVAAVLHVNGVPGLFTWAGLVLFIVYVAIFLLGSFAWRILRKGHL